MTYFVYVPFVSSRAGELGALKNLTDKQRRPICPMITVQPVATIDDGSDSTDREFAAERHAKKLAQSGRIDTYDAFFDFSDVFEENGSEYCEALLSHLLKHGSLIVPVLTSVSEKNYDDMIFHVANEHNLPIAVRVFGDKLKNDATWEEQAVEWARDREAYLLLDFGADVPGANFVRMIIDGMKERERWKTIVVASGSFPQFLRDLDYGVNAVTRAEHKLWKELRQTKPELVFGDYTINSPVPADGFDPVKMGIAAKIKYTSGEHWYVWKGRDLKKHATGYKQYIEMCKSLVKTAEFKGAAYSWGDQYIQDCANDKDGPGNPQKWVTVETNHHIVQITDQLLSSLIALSS